MRLWLHSDVVVVHCLRWVLLLNWCGFILVFGFCRINYEPVLIVFGCLKVKVKFIPVHDDYGKNIAVAEVIGWNLFMAFLRRFLIISLFISCLAIINVYFPNYKHIEYLYTRKCCITPPFYLFDSKIQPIRTECWGKFGSLRKSVVHLRPKLCKILIIYHQKQRKLRETRDIGREDCFKLIIYRNPPIDQP